MSDLFTAVGTSVAINILQLAIGCILSLLVYRFLRVRNFSTAWIFIAPLIGILIPLGIYGMIPVFITLSIVGSSSLILPMLFANLIFNMLVPFTDPSFIWYTGYRRLIFALIAGIVAGLIQRALKIDNEKLLKPVKLDSADKTLNNSTFIIKLAHKCINSAGLYLIIGVAIHTVFQKYLFLNILNLFSSNTLLSAIPRFFAAGDVANPLFLLTMTIINMFFNLTSLSGVLFVSKIRGFLFFIAYYLAWAFLFGIPAFI